MINLKKSDLEKKINHILNEEETFMLSLILLAHMHEDEKYSNLSELMFLFDNYKGFKQFMKYYEGTTIEVPTIKELKQALRLLNLFQKVMIDKKDFDKCYDALRLNELNLDKQYCRDEIDKFYTYLSKDGAITLKQIKKLSKLF